MTVGEQIKKKKLLLKMQQGELARLVGITQSRLSRIESGKIQKVAPLLLRKFAEVLEEPINYFYAEEGKPISQNVRIVIGVKDAGEEILSKFYSKGKEVILKSSRGKAEIKGKVIECTKSFGEEDE